MLLPIKGIHTISVNLGSITGYLNQLTSRASNEPTSTNKLN